MQSFVITLLNGLSFGLLLFMLSAGLTLIFSMLGVLNFAHTSFYMLGAYVGFSVAARAGFWSALVVAPLVFPDRIDAGLRVTRLGTSSVRYEVGLFREGDAEPAAQGHFVHVYVDRATRRPVNLPPELRAALEPLCGAGPAR